VVIGTDGIVQKITVVTGPPALAQSAVEAVRQWRFKPTLINGKPVEVMTEFAWILTQSGEECRAQVISKGAGLSSPAALRWEYRLVILITAARAYSTLLPLPLDTFPFRLYPESG
jgi:TonB-like protein